MNRILIIEDDISINKILSHELKNKDYQVDSLYDGKEACQKILSNEYDLVLVDWMLPYKDGIGIIRECREMCIRDRYNIFQDLMLLKN